VTTSTTKPYSWIKRVPPALLQRDSKPLVGYPPEFPWEKFSKEIGKVFGAQEISITPAQICEWREAEALFSGIGDRHHVLKFSITPLTGNAFWVIAEDDIALLMSMMVTQQEVPIESLDQDFKQGFYHFLALEVINTFTAIGFDKGLTPHLESNTGLPNETCLSLDVSITIKQRTLLGRLILSPDLLQSWKERYAQRTINASIAQDVTITVCLEAGRISLKSSEWTKVALGDFITLDSCTLKSTGEGRIMLTVQGFPCFRGKVKEGNIKILEHPLYHEADIAMDNNFPDDDMEVDHDHDFSFLETEEEIVAEEEQQNETDEKLVEEKTLVETDLDIPSPTEAQKPVALVEEEKKPFTIEDIPLSIVVEVGRLQMSVGKLMELQPGNLLDLNIHPENGVDLVVNGNRIAKGELLLIGECLGVRILDING
jgi:flagellar motor switch protein FliN/FliY